MGRRYPDSSIACIYVLQLQDNLLVNTVFAASPEVRQAYKQFIATVVELFDREVATEDFREVALAVYRLFAEPNEGEEDERRVVADKQ